MNLDKAISQVNTLIDDQLPSDMIVGWINDALAEVGMRVGAVYPEVNLDNASKELPLPNIWQRLVILPFTAGRAKEQDSSQFEYEDFYNQFFTNVAEFEGKYEVPDKYRELEFGITLDMPDGTTYEVENGESLATIAEKNNTTVPKIKAINSDDDILFLGNNSYKADFSGHYWSW